MRNVYSADVLSYEEGQAHVRVALPCGADGCQSCGGCDGHGSPSPSSMNLTLPVPEPLQPRDRIQIELTLPNEALLACVVFGIPLIGILAGGVVGYLLGAIHRDACLLLGGAGGLCVGFAVVAGLNRWCGALQPYARFLCQL